jgi:capsular polysaccharide export protein
MSVKTIDAAVPLLRAPPFPGVDVAVSRPVPTAPAPLADPNAIDRLFAAIRDARVGGRFWLPAAKTRADVVVRAKSATEIEAIRARLSPDEHGSVVWLLLTDKTPRAAIGGDSVLSGDVDPWSLLDGRRRLFAHGDDEWVALGLIAGCPVTLLSEGRFGAPGATIPELRPRIAQALLDARYQNPFTGQDDSIETAIARLTEWRRTLEVNATIAAAYGMAWWKRHEIARFLWTPAHPLRFFRSGQRAVAHAARLNGAVAVWPSRISAGMAEYAEEKGVPLIRVEDGFVRSVGLGSNLVPPSSITVDRLGVHFDPRGPSDLEALLANARFPAPLLARARALRQMILGAGISKYGGSGDHVFPTRQLGRRLVLVPGQVEDDMSVLLGGGGLASNLELLRHVRALEPAAEIWFRPHPDVDAGHRKGAIRDADALRHADRVVRGGGMAQLLELVDAVQVLTSLTGFEALLRGREVTCHGMPFYAGWGLTHDLAPVPARRGRDLTLEQLVAAVLILYPRYLDPVTHLPCPPEILIDRITDGTAPNRLRWITCLRQFQGRLTKMRS